MLISVAILQGMVALPRQLAAKRLEPLDLDGEIILNVLHWSSYWSYPVSGE